MKENVMQLTAPPPAQPDIAALDDLKCVQCTLSAVGGDC
jgi:hypothetical protein